MDALTLSMLAACAGFFLAGAIACIPLSRKDRELHAERKARHHWEHSFHRAAKSLDRSERAYLDLQCKAYVRKGRAFVKVAKNG